MKDAEMIELIKQMDARQFSRNRNFDAYREKHVQKAKAHQVRIRSLSRLLTETDSRVDRIRLTRQKTNPELYLLSYHSTKWQLSWSATLRGFELELLKAQPAVASVLDPLLQDL